MTFAPELRVTCLCAEWCTSCREYRSGFDGLAAGLPQVHFCWLDIEDEAEALGDLDVENFPTLFIQRRESVLFFGTMLPHLHLLHRLIENFHEQSYEESQSYAWASPERVSWQENKDLGRLRKAAAP